jgi:hypothetical protein
LVLLLVQSDDATSALSVCGASGQKNGYPNGNDPMFYQHRINTLIVTWLMKDNPPHTITQQCGHPKTGAPQSHKPGPLALFFSKWRISNLEAIGFCFIGIMAIKFSFSFLTGM